MIIVTGATGKLGSAIVRHLVARVAPAEIAVSVRDPGKAADLAGLGVDVRHGDFDDPDSLAGAFKNASRILMVSSNAAASGGDPLAQHRNAIGAAKSAGARHIFYTSHMGASATSAFPPMRDHHATEQMLGDCGVRWTALRNGFYAESAFAFIGDGLASGSVAVPADGKVSWTTHADLAEAAAILLGADDPGEGPSAPLIGAEALDFADLARLASEATGRTVTRTIIADEALEAAMAARGAPSAAAAIVLGFYRAARAGEFAAVDSALEQLLGRPPQAMREVVRKRPSA